MPGRLFNFHFNWCLLLVIFLNFIDLWSFTVITWICREYCRTVLFWIFLFFEGLGWGKWIYGKIKTVVKIKRMNKILTPNLDSPLQYSFTNYYIPLQKWMDDQCFIHLLSQCYVSVGKVILLKAIKIMANWHFSLTHTSLSQIVILVLLSFLSSLFYSFSWMYFFCFPSVYVHLLFPDKSRSVLSSKSYPCMKWFDGAWTGICLSVFFVFFPCI